jgi:hypothetical protein
VIFFDSRDCLKKKPPLSSFKIRQSVDEKDAPQTAPVWERDLRRALLEAKRKIDFAARVKVPQIKSSRSNSGDGASVGDRVERRHLEGCLR